jgi:hypothetical protein
MIYPTVVVTIEPYGNYTARNFPVRVWIDATNKEWKISNGNALTCSGLELSELGKLGGKLSFLRSPLTLVLDRPTATSLDWLPNATPELF